METNISLFGGLSLKISDTPQADKLYSTGRLQKGLLLQDQGQELAEEAVGFGLPVLKRGLQTIFPGSVVVTSLRSGPVWNVRAVFTLNLVERISQDGQRELENGLLYEIKNFMAAVIRHIPFLRGLLTEVSNMLRKVFKWETTYSDAGFSAELTMLYAIDQETGNMTVEVDTSSLHPSVTEVIIMNEQGAHYFDRYRDTAGVTLQGDEIGCWDVVNAEEAWFENSLHPVAFKLRQIKGVSLFRGRELIGSRLAWAGFGYSFPRAIKKLRYQMSIEKRV